MAVRPDFSPGQDYDLGFLTQLLRSGETFEGTNLAEPMRLMGNTIAGAGGVPLDPEVRQRTLNEAKRLMGGGIPREQLEETKNLLRGKVREFFDAAKNNEVYDLPPHLLESKEYMAGQVRSSDARAKYFSNRYLGMTPDEIQEERINNASMMLALMVDQMGAELSNEDEAELVGSVKSDLDEGSVGGIEGADQFVDPRDVSGIGRNRTFTGQGPGTVGTQPVDRFPQDAAIDVDSRKIEGPFSAVFPSDYQGTGHEPRQDMDFAKEAMDILEPDELATLLQQAQDLINAPLERQIAKFQDPNPLMWLGVALAGIFFPNMRPALLALPFNVGLGEMQRQQAIFDKAYVDATGKQKQVLDLLTKRADLVQRERQRVSTEALTVRKQDLDDIFRYAELEAKGGEADRKRIGEIRAIFHEQMYEKGGGRETLLPLIQELNTLAPGSASAEQAQAMIATAEGQADVIRRDKESAIKGRDVRTSLGEQRFAYNEKTEDLRIRREQAGTLSAEVQAMTDQYKWLNLDTETMLRWEQIAQSIRASEANIANVKEDNLREREIGKMKGQLDIFKLELDANEKKRTDLRLRISGIQREITQRAAGLGSTADLRAMLEGVDGAPGLNEQLRRMDETLGEPGAEGKPATGTYKLFEEWAGKVDATYDKLGGIDRPGAFKVPETKKLSAPLPAGTKDSNTIKGPEDDGIISFDNRGTMNLNRLYGFGSKGEDNKIDCSGAVCEYIKSTGSEAVKDFPQGSIEQIDYIESHITAKTGYWESPGDAFWKAVNENSKIVETHNEWVKRFNAASQQERLFLLNEEPPKGQEMSVHKFLGNGDIVYFNVPKTDSNSGRHVGVFVGLDKDGNALIAEAFSAREKDKEQVRVRAYDLDALLPKSRAQVEAKDTKFIIGAYRFRPKGK